MRKVRLLWDGSGALEIPQVFDAQNQPLFFAGPGALCVVFEDTLNDPALTPFLTQGDLRQEVITEGWVPEPAAATTPLPEPKETPAKKVTAKAKIVPKKKKSAPFKKPSGGK
jgi:hypothetical protein